MKKLTLQIPNQKAPSSADVLVSQVMEENDESKKRNVDSDSSVCCDDRVELKSIISTETALQYTMDLENFFLSKGLLDDATWAGSASSRIVKVLQETKK